MIKKKCNQCGKEFESYSSANRKHCSIECRTKARRKYRPSCKICGTTVKRWDLTYCSIKCRTVDFTGRKKPYLLKRVKKICPQCRSEFEAGGRSGKKRDQVYCSNKCSHISRRLSVDHFWNKDGRTKNANWNRLRQEIIERDAFTCKFCNEKKGNLQIHHQIPRKYGGTHEVDNLLTSCRHCHGSIDRVIALIILRNPDIDPVKLITKFMKLLT